MRVLAILLVLTLAVSLVGCSVREDPVMGEPIQRFTSAPVVQHVPRVVEREKPVPCVTDIPDEPPLISGRLTGVAKYDIGPLEQSARDLRQALREARRLLQECAKGERG